MAPRVSLKCSTSAWARKRRLLHSSTQPATIMEHQWKTGRFQSSSSSILSTRKSKDFNQFSPSNKKSPFPTFSLFFLPIKYFLSFLYYSHFFRTHFSSFSINSCESLDLRSIDSNKLQKFLN